MFPKGEKLRRAITWVNEGKENLSKIELARIVSEASVKFDLNPLDSEFLARFFKEEPLD